MMLEDAANLDSHSVHVLCNEGKWSQLEIFLLIWEWQILFPYLAYPALNNNIHKTDP